VGKSPKSHLLEQLRAQAQSVASLRAQERQLSRDVIERLDRRLHAIFQYFDEACKLLQIISPAIEREFVLPQVARFHNMRFERGMVLFRRQPLQHRDVYAHVVVYYSLTGPVPAPVRVAVRRSPEVERALTAANIEFSCETDSAARGGALRSVIHIAPGLRCEIRFDPDFVNDSIIVTLRNVDRFDPVIFDFRPGALETEALDDLVNVILGKPSQFLHRAPLRGFDR
jgi:hypothetical protein